MLTPMSRVRALVNRVTGVFRSREARPSATPACAPPPIAGLDLSGFVDIPGAADSIDVLSPQALGAAENQNVLSAGRASDAAEALSDEKQDLTSSLNFPLHWTTARESWDYLFDVAVACELLGPRPDDLVLDLAAGTGWATELLNRLGVRTVSIDLSVEMMRRGRKRLEADTRLTFRSDARFVTARGQALAFTAEVFDGVLCMNALHHHPSYREVLEEIYRVLRPGGRAVFSEPGTAHATQPLSVFRMREEHILEKPVALPLIHRIAMDTGFSAMKVVPLRSASEYAFDYTATAADGEPLRRLWEDTIRHVPREHARFVLYKGGEPAADTLLPSVRLVGRLSAHIETESIAPDVTAGQVFTDRLTITNAGSVIWRARGRRFGGQVTCGVKVYDGAGVLLREDLGRTPLPHDVRPGERVTLDVSIQAELPPGTCTLRYDMVVEGVTWFEFQGSAYVERPLRVRAAP